MPENNSIPVNTNFYRKGLFRDVDYVFQPEETFRDNLNGRIIFNNNSSYSYCNNNGMVLAFTITPYYHIKGWAEFPNKLAIISSNGTDTEIGIAVFNRNKNTATYTILFNDKYDPYGDRLNITERVRVKPYSETGTSKENEYHIERIYWGGYPEPLRVFNIALASRYNISSANGYPSWYSVHSMENNCDFIPGDVEYSKRISGGLLSGSYQYTCRQITRDGYVTPWFPTTRKLPVTDRGVSASNWNETRITDSQINSGAGNELYVYLHDIRYEKYQVAYIYSISDTAPLEASIFYEGNYGDNLIDPNIASGHIVKHIKMGDVLMDTSEIVQSYLPLETINDFEIKDHILFAGGYKETEMPYLSQAKLAAITVKPNFRLMMSDTNPHLNSVPITHQVPMSLGYVWKTTYLDRTIGNNGKYRISSFNIINDYKNYKGTQVAMRCGGFWRDQTYRLGIKFRNKKGFSTLVQHICDITTPTQYGNGKFTIARLDANENAISTDYYVNNNGEVSTSVPASANFDGQLTEKNSLTHNILHYEGALPSYPGSDPDSLYPDFGRNNDGSAPPGDLYWLRIMNLVFGNIDLTDIIDNISAVEFVMAKREESIVAQGLIIPTVRIVPFNIGYPLPTNYNGWVGLINTDNSSAYLGHPVHAHPHEHTFEAPDFFEDGITDLTNGDRIEIIAGLTALPNPYLGTLSEVQLNDGNYQYYVKLYQSNKNTIFHSFTNIYHKTGDYSLVTKIQSIADAGGNTSTFATRWNTDLSHLPGYVLEHKMAYHHPKTIVLTLPSWHRLANSQYNLSFALANYKRKGIGNYGGLSKASLASTVYHSIGEHLTLTDTVKTRIKNNQNQYILDGYESFGGDCYVDYYAYNRWIPYHDGTDADYGNSLIFPYESKYNHMIYRHSNNFAQVGTKASTDSGFPLGFYIAPAGDNRIENYDLLATASMQDNLFITFSKPANFQRITDFPYSYIWSAVKTHGEEIDNFRIFPVANKIDGEGTLGPITSLMNWNNILYGFQEQGIGYLPINERESVTTTTGSPLIIGTGTIIPRIDYISRNYGCQHKFSILRGITGLFWIDMKNGKLCRLSQNGLSPHSDMIGMHDFMTNLSKNFIGTGDIHGIYDKKNHELIWTMTKFATENIKVSDDAVLNNIPLEDDDEQAPNPTPFEDGGPVPQPITGPPAVSETAPPISTSGSIGVSDSIPPTSLTNTFASGVSNNSQLPANRHTSGSSLSTFQTLSVNQQLSNELTRQIGIPVEVINVQNNATGNIPANERPVIAITFVINELLNEGAFSGFESFIPDNYLTFGDSLFADKGLTENIRNNNHALWRLNEGEKCKYYDKYYDNILEFVIANNPNMVMVFDNLIINITENGFNILNRIDMITETETQIIVLPDHRIKYKEGKIYLPLRGLVSATRLRGTYLRIKLYFENHGNLSFKLTNTSVKYRLSPKYI